MESKRLPSELSVLEDWKSTCDSLSHAHSKAALFFSILHYGNGLLIIILSGLIGVDNFKNITQILSVTVVILASIHTFFKFSEWSSQNKEASSSYQKIVMELQSQIVFNKQDPDKLLFIQDKIDSIRRNAPFVFKPIHTNSIDLSSPNKPLIDRASFHISPIDINQLREDHFLIESKYFVRFHVCPQDFESYKKRYSGRDLILCEARSSDKLIGHAIIEKYDDEHYHLWIIIVEEQYRKLGIGKDLVKTICFYISSKGGKYISLFTYKDAAIGRIFRGNADALGSGEQLEKEEIKSLNFYLKSKGLQENQYGQNRTIKGYYILKNGDSMDATFKTYRI